MYIYRIVDLETNRAYVGKTIKPYKKRQEQHWSLLKKGKHHNVQLQRIYNKDPNRLVFKLLQEDINSLVELNLLEIFYIEQIGSLNMTKGGDGGDTLSNHPDKVKINAKIKANKKQAKGVSSHNYKQIPVKLEERVLELWNTLNPPSIKEVAGSTGLTQYLVKRILLLNRINIPPRIETQRALINAGKIVPNKKGIFTKEQLESIVKMYVEDWMPCKKIGKIFGLRGESAILKALKERKVTLRTKGEWTAYNNRKRTKKHENY